MVEIRSGNSLAIINATVHASGNKMELVEGSPFVDSFFL